MSQVILSDENCVGHARTLFHALKRLGYVELLGLELLIWSEAGLSEGADDKIVWLFCQKGNYLLLTGNRTKKDGIESLEHTIQDLVTDTSLPVITIGDMERLRRDRLYCERCAERLAEIVMDLNEKYLGRPRLYLS